MAINPINIVTMARTQDYTSIKQNEDNRAAMMQITTAQQEDKAQKLRAGQVFQKEEVNWQQKKFDAKEKGDNEYGGDGGKKRSSKQEDKVIKKGQQGFDIKI
ncbi:MAG: hypothetical protein IKK33_12415 [Lachnospiraceae bacterium]|nr:hypothetical protein [Lachnospiraceae bacterium]